MTTKTQNLAMFAVAAFALGGMAFAPAYADDQWTYNYVNDTAYGTTQTSAVDNDDCGDPYTTCGTYTEVLNNDPSDKVKVHYKVITATCDVNIDVYKNNVKQGSTFIDYGVNTTPSNPWLYQPFTFSISSTDDIRTETHFTNCSWP